jgi:hypothetical protein
VIEEWRLLCREAREAAKKNKTKADERARGEREQAASPHAVSRKVGRKGR